MTVAYLAADGFEQELAVELGSRVLERHGRLFLASEGTRPAWAQNVWLAPERLAVRSIKDAAQQLRDRQRNWALYSHEHHRRAVLIDAALPHVSAKPIAPFSPPPSAPLGSFMLLDRDTVLASASCESAFPNGAVRFLEDREGPPSRAYLKLWEALTLAGEWPREGDRVVDLGSAPGGWTWVLAERGASVTSVDKAPLAPAVGALCNVTERRESAFGLDPASVGPVDWVFSDIICYPDRLERLVDRWAESNPDARFVVTIKLQGETDHAAVARFQAKAGRVVHLAHNRHELTWLRGV
ncbi:MAG: SAM-dependent methyltransferase [Sandaracinaceae bacterium]